jgi:hypothetical protein
MEYEIEAEFIHEFMQSLKGFSTPIIGSGNNAKRIAC